jgi:hypothetical protein
MTYTLKQMKNDSLRAERQRLAWADRKHDAQWEEDTGYRAYHIGDVSLGDILLCIGIIGLLSFNGIAAYA